MQARVATGPRRLPQGRCAGGRGPVVPSPVGHPGLAGQPRALVRVAADTSGAAGEAPATVRLTLRKPIGIVFEQKPDGGPVYVAEVVEGGAAARTGQVQPGDVLSKCSAVVLKAGKEGLYESEGYGQRPYDNWEVIEYDCEGKDFKTVMTALRSNNERWGKMDMTLVLRKP